VRSKPRFHPKNDHPVTNASLSRRQTLQRFALAASTLVTTRLASAIAPMPRKGPPRMLLSLAAYSLRNHFAGPLEKGPEKPATEPRFDMFSFLDYCADNHCAGAELTSYFFPRNVDDTYLANVRKHAFLKGIAISGTAIGNNFSLEKGPKRDEEIAKCKTWIDRASILGAPHIRVFAGHNKNLPREAADKLVVESLEECAEYAGSKGIFLGIENHDAIGSAEHLLKLIADVKNPWLGVNLDSGNFRTPDPYHDFERCLPYAVNIQLKTEIHPEGQKTAHPADLKKLVSLIKTSGYQGFVALEYEATESPLDAIPPILANLHSLLS
jgi:sugar phosphate isomerase/epimerase